MAMKLVNLAKANGIAAAMIDNHVRLKGNKTDLNDVLRAVIGKSSMGNATEKDTTTPQVDKILTKNLKRASAALKEEVIDDDFIDEGFLGSVGDVVALKKYNEKNFKHMVNKVQLASSGVAGKGLRRVSYDARRKEWSFTTDKKMFGGATMVFQDAKSMMKNANTFNKNKLAVADAVKFIAQGQAGAKGSVMHKLAFGEDINEATIVVLPKVTSVKQKTAVKSILGKANVKGVFGLEKKKDFQVTFTANSRVTKDLKEKLSMVEEVVNTGSIPQGPESIGIKKKSDFKFKGHEGFDCDAGTFGKCLQGKQKYARWNSYLNRNDELVGRVKEYMGASYKNTNFVLRNKGTGEMVMARRPKAGA
jgi:hypothetical protein